MDGLKYVMLLMNCTGYYKLWIGEVGKSVAFSELTLHMSESRKCLTWRHHLKEGALRLLPGEHSAHPGHVH
eukprot:2184768-Prorocentrum_lima.AAC.1